MGDEWNCPYCRWVNTGSKCDHCGAPRTGNIHPKTEDEVEDVFTETYDAAFNKFESKHSLSKIKTFKKIAAGFLLAVTIVATALLSKQETLSIETVGKAFTYGLVLLIELWVFLAIWDSYRARNYAHKSAIQKHGRPLE